MSDDESDDELLGVGPLPPMVRTHSNGNPYVPRVDTNGSVLDENRIYNVKQNDNDPGTQMRLDTKTDHMLKFVNDNGVIINVSNDQNSGVDVAYTFILESAGGRKKTRIMRKKHRRTPRKTKRNKTRRNKTRRNKTRRS